MKIVHHEICETNYQEVRANALSRLGNLKCQAVSVGS